MLCVIKLSISPLLVYSYVEQLCEKNIFVLFYYQKSGTKCNINKDF